MAKAGEWTYFKEIGQAGMDFTLAKPFSDPRNVGSLLSDIAAVFAQLPEPPARILDLGCGSGWTSNFYAQAGYEVVGVDISSDAIKAAKKHFTGSLSSLTFRCADYDELEYKDEFDAAIFFDALHHSEDENDGLRAALAALKPGGVIILCEPGVGHSQTEASKEAIRKYGVNERDMPPKLSKKGLRTVGFTDVKTYAYPAIAHRVLFTARTGKQAVRNHPLLRGLTSFATTTLLRRNHGLVTARKPTG